MPGQAQSVTIAAGQSLSTSISLSSGAVALVIMPPDWTSANVSFQVSADGTTYVDLVDVDGKEILRAVRAGTAIIVDKTITQAVGYLKVRSGSRDRPVPQEADRTINLVVV